MGGQTSMRDRRIVRGLVIAEGHTVRIRMRGRERVCHGRSRSRKVLYHRHETLSTVFYNVRCRRSSPG